MEYLVRDRRLNLSGFLCPGHVSSIIGTKPYEFIPKRYKIGCCITGFEPLDILEGVYFLIQQIVKNKPEVANQYMRVVNPEGNLKAQRIIFDVFKVENASWRGLGRIPKSGLKIKDAFSQFDAEERIPIGYELRATSYELRRCRCGDILKGLALPLECPLFSKVCKPAHPIGPCMVSSEGTCNAYYKYH
jgi:hydrogenase expression/formation protein HypD